MSYLRLLCTLCLLLMTVAVTAQTKTLKVVTKVVTPFVIEDKGELTGFSIDLWKAISQQLKLKTEFAREATIPDLFATLKAKKADMGIAAISITSEREQIYDFSQPMFNSGLQIMVRHQEGSSAGGSMPGFIKVIFGRSVMEMLGIMLLLCLIPAHVVWFFERKHKNGFLEHTSYLPGIWKAYWWAAGTLGAQADEMPRGYVGRFVAVFWMFVSIVFVAYFTAAATASLTVEQLQGSIKGPEDLPGKRVVTTRGSTSAKYLREVHADVKEVDTIESAFKSLEGSDGEKVDALVFDAPVLLYYASHEGKGKVDVIGKIFREENYGIAFPQDGPLRKEVNLALLKLKENGTYQQIYDKWFTDSSKP